jgi:ferredoxin
MNDTVSDSSAVESGEAAVAVESSEYSESLGECTTPELSAGEGPRAAKKKRAREREMQRRRQERFKKQALEALRARKRQRKLTRGGECRGCGACMLQ